MGEPDGGPQAQNHLLQHSELRLVTSNKEVYYILRCEHISYSRLPSDDFQQLDFGQIFFFAWGITASSLHKGCTKGTTPPQNLSIKGPT